MWILNTFVVLSPHDFWREKQALLAEGLKYTLICTNFGHARSFAHMCFPSVVAPRSSLTNSQWMQYIHRLLSWWFFFFATILSKQTLFCFSHKAVSFLPPEACDFLLTLNECFACVSNIRVDDGFWPQVKWEVQLLLTFSRHRVFKSLRELWKHPPQVERI